MSRQIVFSILLLILLAPFLTLHAQTTTGRVVGRVVDESGAFIPGVEITVRNPATNLSRAVITAETGDYNFPLLPPGVYEIEASLSGFRREVRRGITLQVDAVIRVDFTLRVGNLSEQIEVVADAPLVQSDSASVGQVINSRNITDLPLNARHFMALTTLTVGVQPSVEGSNLSNQNLSFHSIGARERDNNFLLDGVDNNDTGNGQLVIVPSIDAIQEFKVQTSTYGAEMGRAGGAAVNIQTKAGTNGFHGTVFEFLRNDVFDARNYFAASKPPYRRNQFGTVVAGPIVRDKTFFMFNYEGNRIRQGQTALATVPTLKQRSGDFSDLSTPIVDPMTRQPFDGNVIPASRMNAIGRKFVEFYPSPNRQSVQNNYLTNARLLQDFDIITARVDHRLSENHTVYGRYTWQDAYQESPEFANGTTLPGFGAVFFQPIGHNAMLSDVYVFGPRVVNEFRVGFNRLKGGIFEELYRKGNLARELGIRGVQTDLYPHSEGLNFGFPRVDINEVSRQRGTYAAQLRFDNTWHWFDMLALTHGTHQMKMGAEVRTMMLNIFIDSNPNGYFLFTGQYSGNGLADTLLGYPAQSARGVGDSHVQNRSRATSLFFQDDWKVSSSLTLNVGARWELQTAPVNAIGDLAFFDIPSGQIVIGGKEGPQTYPHPINFRATGETITVPGGLPFGIPRGGYETDLNDFAPRFGFAWSPSAASGIAVRGGYGMFYVPVISAITHTHRDIAYPFTIPQSFIGSPAGSIPNISMSDPFPDGLGRSSITPRSIDKNLRNGYMQSWNLGVQRQIGGNMVLDVSYAGSKGTKLDGNRNINQAVLGSGSVASRRPFPQFSTIPHIEKSATSSYHSLQARFERRLASGWSFITAYTWSHSIDTDSGSTGVAGGGSQNAYNIGGDIGNSVFDIRHRLVYSYSYELPFGPGKPLLGQIGSAAAKVIGGWQVAGITTFSSGQSFTPEIPGDGSNTGTTFVRPHRIKDPILERGERTPNRYFDTTAFVRPTPGTFGNAGRGILKAPGINNWDLTLTKNTQLFEDHNLQFRVEFFNLANHPNFLVPERTFTSKAFGSVLRARDARQVQFGLKYIF